MDAEAGTLSPPHVVQQSDLRQLRPAEAGIANASRFTSTELPETDPVLVSSSEEKPELSLVLKHLQLLNVNITASFTVRSGE